MGSVQLLNAHPLLVGGQVAIDDDCCCQPGFVAINICNANKYSDEIHDVWLNDATLSQASHKLPRPNVDANGLCGGGYYSNVSPLPGLCSLADASGLHFTCCGTQVGGICNGTNYPAGIYPATGAANEDPDGSCKRSNFMACGTSGRDCSGDLVQASFSSSLLVSGQNRLDVVRTGSLRSAGSYGVIEIARLEQVSGVWRIAGWYAQGAQATYTSGTVTLFFTL